VFSDLFSLFVLDIVARKNLQNTFTTANVVSGEWRDHAIARYPSARLPGLAGSLPLFNWLTVICSVEPHRNGLRCKMCLHESSHPRPYTKRRWPTRPIGSWHLSIRRSSC